MKTKSQAAQASRSQQPADSPAQAADFSAGAEKELDYQYDLAQTSGTGLEFSINRTIQPNLSPAKLLYLQNTIGNRNVQRLLSQTSSNLPAQLQRLLAKPVRTTNYTPIKNPTVQRDYAGADQTVKAQVDAKFTATPRLQAPVEFATEFPSTNLNFASDQEYKDWLADVWALSAQDVAVRPEATLVPLLDSGFPRHLIEKLSKNHVAWLIQLKNDVIDNLTFDLHAHDAKDQVMDWVDDFEKSSDFNTLQTSFDGNPCFFVAILLRNKFGDAINQFMPEDYNWLADSASLMTARVDSARTGHTNKQLSNVEVGNLPIPPNTVGDYFGANTDRASTNLGEPYYKKQFLSHVRNNVPEQGNIRDEMLNDYTGNEKKEYLESNSKFTPYQQIQELYSAKNVGNTNWGQQQKAPFSMPNMHSRERGSIFQYTTTLYQALGGSLENQSVNDYSQEDTQKRAEDSRGVTTLKFTLPMLKAMTSGLQKLPVYTGGPIYRGSGNSELNAELPQKRKEWADAVGLKVGAIESYSQAISTSKSFQACYIKKDNCGVGFIIEENKTGRDVQLISNSVEEEEVLVPPGSRYVITRVDPAYQVDSKTKLVIFMKEL